MGRLIGHQRSVLMAAYGHFRGRLWSVFHGRRQLVDDELDLDPFYTPYAKAKGKPPYDPRLMLRIVLYGYSVGSAPPES